MLRNFSEIEDFVISRGLRKRIALCGAHDDLALGALVRARRRGFVTASLIGDGEKIRALLDGMGESAEDYEILDEKRELRSAAKAIGMVNAGEADIPMKGLMQTASFLMAIQTPFGGLMDEGALLNEYTAFFWPEQQRLLLAGDCAINIAPTLEEKKLILANLIRCAGAFRCERVKAACVSVLEKPNPNIQSSVDADSLAHMDWGENAVVEGPFGLDNALSAEAAKHKGIVSEVAGHADVLLMPDMHAGNVLHKCIHFFGHMPYASGTLGARTPIIMNSRTDDEDAKYYSILCAVLQAGGGAV